MVSRITVAGGRRGSVLRRKFNNKKVVRNGVVYDSKKELGYKYKLDKEVKDGKIKSYALKPVFELKVNGKLIARHIPDFMVTTLKGEHEIREVKGGKATQTDVWRIKKKLMEALFPNIKYVVIAKPLKKEQ